MSDYFNFIESSKNHMDYVKKMREKLNLPKEKPKGEKRRTPVKTKEEEDQLRFNTFAGNIDYLSNRGKMTTAKSKAKAPNDPSLTGGEQGFVGDFSVQRGPLKGGIEAFHYTPATFFPNQHRGGFKHNIAGTGINPVAPEFKAKASFMDYNKNTEYFAKSGLPLLNEGLPSFEAGIKHWPGRKKEQQPKPYSEMRYGGQIPQYKEGGQTGQWPPPGFGPASLQMLQQMMPYIGYQEHKVRERKNTDQKPYEPWMKKPTWEKFGSLPYDKMEELQRKRAKDKKEDIWGNPDYNLYTPEEMIPVNKKRKEEEERKKEEDRIWYEGGWRKKYTDGKLNETLFQYYKRKCDEAGCEKPVMRYGGVVSKSDKKKKKGCGCKDKH